jgi:chaperonin GroES
MKLTPLSNNIIIQPVKELEKTKGGILLPQSAEKEKPQQGKVVFVGPGKKNSAGKVIPMEVKKGDIVLFNKYGPHEIKIEGKEYLIANENDILAIIEE